MQIALMSIAQIKMVPVLAKWIYEALFLHYLVIIMSSG